MGGDKPTQGFPGVMLESISLGRDRLLPMLQGGTRRRPLGQVAAARAHPPWGACSSGHHAEQCGYGGGGGAAQGRQSRLQAWLRSLRGWGRGGALLWRWLLHSGPPLLR